MAPDTYLGVPVTRLPPGPEPDVPFVDQVRRAPDYACGCGARRRFGSDVKGRCGCQASTRTWTADDEVDPRLYRELPPEILQQLQALPLADLQRLRWSVEPKALRVHALRELMRRRLDASKKVR